MWQELQKFKNKLFKVFFEPLYFKSDEFTRNLCVIFSIVSLTFVLSQLPMLIQISFFDKHKHLASLLLVTTSLHFAVYILTRTGWLRTGSVIFATTLIGGIYSAIKTDPRVEVLLCCMPYLLLSILVLAHLSPWRITLFYSIVCAFAINDISRLLPKEVNEAVTFATILFCALATTIAILKKHFHAKLETQRIMSIYHSRLASLSEMGGGIAHEINNPLTIIQGYAAQLTSMIHRKQLPDDKVVYAAEKIIETSERIAKIVYKLRSYSRDGEKEPFRTEEVKVIVESALDFCRARFRNHNIKINFAEIPAHLLVNCRPVQLIQSIFNLLNNSFDAVSKLSEKWIQIDVKELEDQIEIHVTDSGKGIPDSVANKMYDPFFTTKDIGQASGLGLSITNSLLAMHGGKIHLDTTTKNTCFVITLPKFVAVSAQTKLVA